jgi:hypothetical protein
MAGLLRISDDSSQSQFETPIEFQNKNSRQSHCRDAGVGISYHGTEGLAPNNPARAQSQPLVLRPHRPLQ